MIGRVPVRIVDHVIHDAGDHRSRIFRFARDNLHRVVRTAILKQGERLVAGIDDHETALVRDGAQPVEIGEDPRVGRQVPACLRVRIGRVADLRVQDVRIGSAFKIGGERGRSGGRQQDLIGARALRFQDRESISHSVRRPLQRLDILHPGRGEVRSAAD